MTIIVDKRRFFVFLRETVSFLNNSNERIRSPPLVCVMIAGRETQNNGIMKMLALPVDRQTLSLAKFCVLVFYLFMEMVVFFVVFIVAGWLVTPV